MTPKYLYGKKEFLYPIIEGMKSPRFSDISHYARLENELMRDKETSKDFVLDKHSTQLEVNGLLLSPEDMTEDPIFSFPVKHCFCLCLSNRKNSDELFDKFKADICIEIDVDKLAEILDHAFSGKLQGMRIKAENITYFNPKQPPPTQEMESLVFYKPESFKHEDEYRIALFYPQNKVGFKTKDGINVPFSKEDDSMHLEFASHDPRFITQIILGYHEKETANA